MIVPVYNAVRILPTTVPSWLRQDVEAEWLLVDDGSTDGTRALLETLTASRADVLVLNHAANRGRAAARNTGIAAATGEILLFLDADMQPEPDFVRRHAQLHRTPEVVGVVSSPVLEGLDPADPYHAYLKQHRGAASVGPGRPLPFKYFIIGYTSVKAEAVREVGGFDERLSYGEDLDFAYRLWHRFPEGLRYSDRPVIHHHDHGSLDERLAKLREFGRDNLPVLLAKHPGLGRAAGVDFVACSPAPRSLRGRIKGALLRPVIAAALRRVLPYLPQPALRAALRYVMASSVAEAYRSHLLSSP